MKCPICSAELAAGALSCPACGAIQTVERTPLGVLSGWIGIVASVLTAMILVPVPLMFLGGVSLKGFPWVLPIIGLCIMAVAFWHSRSTRHTVWLARRK